MHSWKLLLDSVIGTSHIQTNQPCQDYATGRELEVCGDRFLVLVCADGAGSASRSELGSRFVCTSLLNMIASALESGLELKDITRERVVEWHAIVRRRLSMEACRVNVDLREFATTILTAIIGPSRALFSHIGDGVIVYDDGEEYRTPFWPQQGEYANTTYFLTSRDFEDQLAFEWVDRQVDEVALLTDGLQPLALHYATRSVHSPFFQPMFTALRGANDPEELRQPLKTFMNSPAVNSRTDDDKTLVLATRR
jgi:hypothetical protein